MTTGPAWQLGPGAALEVVPPDGVCGVGWTATLRASCSRGQGPLYSPPNIATTGAHTPKQPRHSQQSHVPGLLGPGSESLSLFKVEMENMDVTLGRHYVCHLDLQAEVTSDQ